MVPTPSRSATRRMDSACSPSVSATSMAARTIRSTLRSGLPFRLTRSLVRQSYRGKTALDGFDLQVAEGTVCGLLGLNGAGKTTAVRILTTLLRADGGHASVAGHDVARHPRRVRRAIGLVGQYAAVDEVLTGRQNLELFGRLYHLDARAARDRAAELLDAFGLDHPGPVGEYSGGMRRRLEDRKG